MPAKGQTCLTCSAPCCHKIVGYKYPAGAEKLPKPVERYSRKELLSLGMIELALPYQEKGCRHLAEDAKCGIEHHKPRLCRTYWCHGRLWKPKVVI